MGLFKLLKKTVKKQVHKTTRRVLNRPKIKTVTLQKKRRTKRKPKTTTGMARKVLR